MRPILLALLLAAGCGGPAPPPLPPPPPPPPLSAADAAVLQSIERRRQREDYLVSLALVSSPELRPSIRRAAEVEVGEPPAGREQAKAWRVRLDQAEAHLAVKIEGLAARRAATLRQYHTEATCDARGRMATATYPDRSLLRLDALTAGQEARRICLDLYRTTGQLAPF